MSYANMVEFAALEKELHCLEAYEREEQRKAQLEKIAHKTETRLLFMFKWISKKAFFITSVPFYWFIVFKYFIGTFDMGLFVFIVAASFFMSFFGINWGILNGFAR